MTSRKSDIDALISHIQTEYKIIENLYKNSLRSQEIKLELKIKVKNYLENARSVLDFCAHDIADAIGVKNANVYFPIIDASSSLTGFQGSIGRNLPMLETKNKELFDYLQSIQPYNPDCEWFGDFVTVTNDTKHSQLTPQIKTETERIVSQHTSGGMASWNPAAVKFGAGAFINGALVNHVTQLPAVTPETKVTRETWVDFRFNNSISALPLLKQISETIPTMIETVYQLL